MLLGIFLAGRNGQREVADLKLRAVCREAGCNARRGARAEIAADRGCADQDNLRLVLVDDFRERVRVRLGSVLLELRIIDQDHTVRAVSAELFRLALHAGTEQHCRDVGLQCLCEVLCLTD